jgi:hypothetical protein
MCLRGASEVNSDVLAKIPTNDVRAYAVWVPKRKGKEADVAEATATVTDGRATHFWDGAGVLLRAFAPVLGLREDAWDVYMIYGPEARWETSTPPVPAFWMHQLGSSVSAPRLDAGIFAQRLRETIAGSKEKHSIPSMPSKAQLGGDFAQ